MRDVIRRLIEEKYIVSTRTSEKARFIIRRMNQIAEKMVLGRLIFEEGQEEIVQLVWMGDAEIKRRIGGVRCRLCKEAR